MSETAEWHGEERRGIPFHILSYIDERLKDHVDHVEKIFTDHTREEMERYGEIMDLIQGNREKTANEIAELNANAQRRHESLVQSLQSYSEGMNHKCQDVSSAFVQGPDGKPDFASHRADHDRRKKFGDWWESVKDKAVTKVIEWGALAFVVWVAHSLWEAFLKGPAK